MGIDVDAGKTDPPIQPVVYSSSQDTTVSHDTDTPVNLVSGGILNDPRNEIDVSNNEWVPSVGGWYFFLGVFTWQTDGGWTTGDRIRIKPKVNVSGTFATSIDINQFKLFTQAEDFVAALPLIGPTGASLSSGDRYRFEVTQESGADKVLGQLNFIIGRISSA